MDNNRLNFIYKLNHIVNENEVGTVEFELAKFFLENFKSVTRWNIYQIAEEQHVSRLHSTICETIGLRKLFRYEKECGNF